MKRVYKLVEPCADCGHDTKKPNSLTKYCTLCALARGAAWSDGRTADCGTCGQPYIAWTGPKNQRSCGTCFMLAAPQGMRESVEATCLACKQPAWVHSPDLHICFPCLHDPALAPRIKLTIAQQAAKRRSPVSGIVKMKDTNEQEET